MSLFNWFMVIFGSLIFDECAMSNKQSIDDWFCISVQPEKWESYCWSISARSWPQHKPWARTKGVYTTGNEPSQPPQVNDPNQTPEHEQRSMCHGLCTTNNKLIDRFRDTIRYWLLFNTCNDKSNGSLFDHLSMVAGSWLMAQSSWLMPRGSRLVARVSIFMPKENVSRLASNTPSRLTHDTCSIRDLGQLLPLNNKNSDFQIAHARFEILDNHYHWTIKTETNRADQVNRQFSSGAN